jgi:hypothetical protein
MTQLYKVEMMELQLVIEGCGGRGGDDTEHYEVRCGYLGDTGGGVLAEDLG